MGYGVCPLDDKSIPNDGNTKCGGVDYCRNFSKTIENSKTTEELNKNLLLTDGPLQLLLNSCNHIRTNHQHRICVLAHMNRTIEIPDIQSLDSLLTNELCEVCAQKYTEKYLIYSPMAKQYKIISPDRKKGECSASLLKSPEKENVFTKLFKFLTH